MVLYENEVYHFENWSHPGGWDYAVGQYAGRMEDAKPGFQNGGGYGGHSDRAKDFLKSNFYGYLSDHANCEGQSRPDKQNE